MLWAGYYSIVPLIVDYIAWDWPSGMGSQGWCQNSELQTRSIWRHEIDKCCVGSSTETSFFFDLSREKLIVS
jgi:hypothetical protein